MNGIIWILIIKIKSYDKNTFGKYLRECQKELGYSVRKLSSCKCQIYLSDIENENNVVIFLRYANYFNFSDDDWKELFSILNEIEERKNNKSLVLKL